MRRKYIVPVLLLLLTGVTATAFFTREKPTDPFSGMEKLIGEITPPLISGKVYDITAFGARPDGSLVTGAIQTAVEKCSNEGGGTVLIPDGTFLTGAIHLKSNVNLHLSDQAVLLFSLDPKDYLPVVKTRWEGIDCYNYSPLIYAADAENISVTGKGILDGQANESNWWKWKGRKEYGWVEGEPSQNVPGGRPLLARYETEKTPVDQRIMGEGAYLRPEFIVTFNCKNVLIEDVTVKNAPFWLLHPLFSSNVIIRGIKAISHGPNNDGCDPESCSNVLIEDCYFNTGDDCIAIKSGRNNDGRESGGPSENIVIRNCHMENGHGGVVIGSEISGGCRNVYVENCEMSSPELERAIRIKTNSLRGGEIENLYFRNIRVGEVKEAVVRINCDYEMKGQEQGSHIPWIHDIYISGVESNKSDYAIFLTGVPGITNIRDIYLEDCNFRNVKKANIIEGVDHLSLKNVLVNGKEIKTEN